MAYFKLNAYDADVRIPQFRGLNQADVGLNPDIRFAAEAENVETPLGVLQPMAANDLMVKHNEFEDHKVETLAVFHRRWYSGSGSHNWYVAGAGGKLYQKQAGSSSAWAEIELPEGVNAYNCSLWSWVSYEINENDTTIDVLLLSNAEDGMIMIVPPDQPSTWNDVKSHTWSYVKDETWGETLSPSWTIRAVDTRADPDDPDEQPKKFGIIERYGERIWGTAIPGEPDMLVYSRPYKPTDWTPAGNDEQPEDGAGDILQPSWDGDQFYALRRFGDQLLAFKKNKIWRVMGLSPGEFTFSEQYGKGTEYFSTIAVNGERVFMADKEGVLVYDGMDTDPYAKEQIQDIWRTVNIEALDQMCAVMFDERYYLSFPTGTSTVNNAMLVYDFQEGTILYYPSLFIESFLSADDALYATSSTLPGQIILMRRDSWNTGSASGAPTKWVTPWMDFGYKQIQKGGFDLYFLPEVQNDEVTFSISIQTEKKTKTKLYTCQPLSESDREANKEHRMKRLHFGGAGRRFRIIIETASGVTAPWRLLGGIELKVETDPD